MDNTTVSPKRFVEQVTLGQVDFLSGLSSKRSSGFSESWRLNVIEP
jgi:hypothetical protein